MTRNQETRKITSTRETYQEEDPLGSNEIEKQEAARQQKAIQRQKETHRRSLYSDGQQEVHRKIPRDKQTTLPSIRETDSDLQEAGSGIPRDKLSNSKDGNISDQMLKGAVESLANRSIPLGLVMDERTRETRLAMDERARKARLAMDERARKAQQKENINDSKYSFLVEQKQTDNSQVDKLPLFHDDIETAKLVQLKMLTVLPKLKSAKNRGKAYKEAYRHCRALEAATNTCLRDLQRSFIKSDDVPLVLEGHTLPGLAWINRAFDHVHKNLSYIHNSLLNDKSSYYEAIGARLVDSDEIAHYGSIGPRLVDSDEIAHYLEEYTRRFRGRELRNEPKHNSLTLQEMEKAVSYASSEEA